MDPKRSSQKLNNFGIEIHNSKNKSHPTLNPGAVFTSILEDRRVWMDMNGTQEYLLIGWVGNTGRIVGWSLSIYNIYIYIS